jgi:hypothetical protein
MAKKSRKTRAKRTQRRNPPKAVQKRAKPESSPFIKRHKGFWRGLAAILSLALAVYGLYMTFGTDIKITITQPQEKPFHATVTLENSGLHTKVTKVIVILHNFKFKKQGVSFDDLALTVEKKFFILGRGGRYSGNFPISGDAEDLASGKVCVVLDYKEIWVWKRRKYDGFYYDLRNKTWVPHICDVPTPLIPDPLTAS